MMRLLLMVLLAVVVVGAVGWYGCMAFGWRPDARAMIIAGLTCLATGGLAAMPAFLARNAAQPMVAQAALVGTIVHLFGSIAVAAIVFLTKAPVGPTFVYWLMAFYLTTLTVLVVSFARRIRLAPSPSSEQK